MQVLEQLPFMCTFVPGSKCSSTASAVRFIICLCHLPDGFYVSYVQQWMLLVAQF